MTQLHPKSVALPRPLALLSALLALAAPAAAQATTVWVANSTTKVRPADAPGTSTSARIAAAKNEFEAFQVVIQGGATGVQATVSDLVGPGTIPSSNIAMYREALYNAVNPSGPDGQTGLWPDALIPDVDAYAHEKRNAFPFDVPAGEERAIWVEVLVPADAAPGDYTGKVSVVGSGIPGGTVDVPVTLHVYHFALPSTPSLKTAFGMWWDGPCQAEYGGYTQCGGDANLEALRSLYVQAALDHRISIEGAVYHGPSNSDWSHFDQVYGPLLDGTAPTRLQGAKLTELRYQANRDLATATNWATHFKQKGWFGQLFDYTCDEPPLTCAWSDIPARASIMRQADPDFRTLVTTTIGEANANGVASDISVMVPVVNFMEPKSGADTRSQYDAYVSAGNELWMYQSCMSHGCGGAFGQNMGGATTTDPQWGGWPTYAIDASGVRNRAQEWISFKDGVTAELYYETMLHSDTAWTDQYDFGGNGDGTLFYPGRPEIIGGTTHVPVESIRLKLIREGIEDYEYLKILTDLGDGDFAMSTAAALFPSAGNLDGVTADQLLAARDAIAQRIESHMAPTTTGGTGSTTGGTGTTTGGTGTTTGGTGSTTGGTGTTTGGSTSGGGPIFAVGHGARVASGLVLLGGWFSGHPGGSGSSAPGTNTTVTPLGSTGGACNPLTARSCKPLVKGGCSTSGGEVGMLGLGAALLMIWRRRR